MPSSAYLPTGPSLQTWISAKAWRERVIAFDPSWFVVTMGTGIIVQNLYLFPFPSWWLQNLGYAFWILEVVLFAFFTAMGCTRLIMYPKVAVAVLDDVSQTAYLGAIPISFDALAAAIVLYYNNRPAAIYVAEVFFWINVVMSVAVSLGGCFVMYQRQGGHSLEQVNGIWLLSFIPMIVTSALGSSLVPYLNGGNLATVLFVSFLILSLGLGLSFIIVTIYYWRLMACNLPPRDAIVSVFVPVGPFGMGAFSIAGLSVGLARYVEASSFVFEQASTQPFNAVSHGAVIQMIIWVGVLSALALLGIATFFLIEAIASVITRVPNTFNVGWWSFVFPCGVYSNAFCRLSQTLRNDGMKGWAAACVIGTALLWLMCAVMTTYKGVWQGKTFSAPGLQGYVEQQAKKRDETRSSDDHASSNGHSTATARNSNEDQWETSPDGTCRRILPSDKSNGKENV